MGAVTAVLNKKQHAERQQPGIKCSGKLSDCKHYTNLIPTLNSYDHSDEPQKIDIDNLNIIDILDDYIHLIDSHDQQFHQIFNSFDKICDIKTCKMFERNHRERMQEHHNADDSKDNAYDLMVKQQILDKIHCYFQHSYDIGHRLVNEEKSMETLAKKHELYRYANGQDKSKKFNLPISNIAPLENKESEEFDDSMFEPGVMFKYLNKSQNIDTLHKDVGYAYVDRKYSSFKQELLSNPVAILAIQQYNSELNKAQKHFNSNYCKILAANQETQSSNKPLKLKVYHILSVMIYCNYDNLQYEFSKTYRKIDINEKIETIAKRHRNFFHLGLFLKAVANEFSYETSVLNASGDTIMRFKTLYHGINQPLMFPLEAPGYTHINVPLSTSTAWGVAVNFSTNPTNAKHGIIVEVEAGGWMAKYFECCWLSDFANEREHLFVQSNTHLSFINVTICPQGIELKCVIRAARILWQFWDYNKRKHTQNIDEECKEVTTSLIEHEMKIQPFKSLHNYAIHLFHQFCTRKTGIKVDWDLITGNYQFLLKYFKVSGLEWIDINQFVKLYPNIDCICTYNVFVSNAILENLLFYLKTNDNIIEVAMEDVKNSKKQIKSFIKEYKIRFIKIGYDMHQTGEYQKIMKHSIYVSDYQISRI